MGLKPLDKMYRHSYLKVLRTNKIPHYIDFTNRTWGIKSKIGRRSFSSNEISRRGMGFMNKVKAYILKNISNYKIYEREYSLVRMKFNNFDKEIYDSSIVEVDLTKAYWTAAHELKIINDELFFEGLTGGYSKIELLASLGCLARNKRRIEFDGKRYGKIIRLDDNAGTVHLWNAITHDVDKVMLACSKSLGEDFYFFWVDAIFFKGTEANKEKVSKIIAKHKYEHKAPFAVRYLRYDIIRDEVWAFTRKNNSHAKDPVRDENGFYGRRFVKIKDKPEMYDFLKDEIEITI